MHVLNDHAYCCVMGVGVCESGEPKVADAAACADWHKTRFEIRDHDAKRLGLPFFLSEFGACLTEGPCTTEIKQVADMSDKILAGWAYWQFKFFEDLTTSAGTGSEGFYNKDGTLQDWKVKALARSYLMATQGVPTLNAFDTETAGLIANWTLDANVDAPTVLYLNSEYWYPNGYTYTVSVDGTDAPTTAYTVDATDKQRLAIQFTEPSYDQKTVSVTVTAKQ